MYYSKIINKKNFYSFMLFFFEKIHCMIIKFMLIKGNKRFPILTKKHKLKNLY